VNKKQLSERAKGYWVFCQDAACRRCYLAGEERIIDGHPWCAYADCEDGDIMDAVSWHVIRRDHPELLEVPERGVRYLYSANR
jgi:hypothetical protein